MSKQSNEYTLSQYEGRYLKISGKTKIYHFQIYKLENYNFDCSLNFPIKNQSGVYIFTKRKVINANLDPVTIGGLTTWKEHANHQLLYCGRTDDLKDRFNKHHKENELKHANFNCLSIFLCDTHKETEDVENDLLNEHNFKFNEILNNWEPFMEEVVSEESLKVQEKSI